MDLRLPSRSTTASPSNSRQQQHLFILNWYGLTACGTPLSSTSLLLIVGVCGISHGLNEFHDDERRWRKCTNQRFEAFDLAAAFFSVATPGDEVLAVLEQDIVAFVSKLAHSSFYNFVCGVGPAKCSWLLRYVQRKRVFIIATQNGYAYLCCQHFATARTPIWYLVTYAQNYLTAAERGSVGYEDFHRSTIISYHLHPLFSLLFSVIFVVESIK